MSKKKQAVLLIHGIGEQRPMDSLRGFIKTVWTNDKSAHHKDAIFGVFSKPDEFSENFELRRLTTTQNNNGVRTDFYEFYWAHLMKGTKLIDVLIWFKQLLLRWPWNVPKHLISTWFLLLLISFIVVALVIERTLPDEYQYIPGPDWITSTMGLFIAWMILPIMNNVIGDAARYLNPSPKNISSRQKIRSTGVKLLKKLHDSGKYDRIIVVGHSLGSVIGYDILTFTWAFYNTKGKKEEHPEMDNLEEYIEEKLKDKSINIQEYQKLQKNVFAELKKNEHPWLVSDFITLGSPLAHAEILLAKNKKNLKEKQYEREFPTCPPILESGKFSYPKDDKIRTMHHAAVFGPTRWTNLYFPSYLIFMGDLIGGPLKNLFGFGINDKKLTTKVRLGILTHTLYWKQKRNINTEAHIIALRKALNLLNI